MRTHSTSRPDSYPKLRAADLRDSYLLEDLFKPGELQLVYTDLDRAVVGSAVPTGETLALEAGDRLRADYFCERRELGVINLGQAGSVTVDGAAYRMANRECLYIGRGSKDIGFSSERAQAPAGFYLLSYPAHAVHPTAHGKLEDANRIELGSKEQASERRLYQYIHEDGIRSCQLVMGFTELLPGSVWNTMPPHTHDRRSEIYCYFDIADGLAVAHFMGEAHETRTLWVGEKQVALSPSWSLHCGVGTAPYAFVWGMGGENQRFDDMDGCAIPGLR